MYCRVLACDFDGTGAINGQLAPELGAALGTARAQGLVTILVTGRVHEELQTLCEDLSMFDAVENDLPLFAMAGVAIAARGAVPAVAAQADDRLSVPGGAGVAQYIYRLLEQGGIVPTPVRHALVLGHTDAGAPVVLPTSGRNVMITGDPRSGKSWLAGLVAERLIEQGYRLCIIDPEGDYLSLGQRRRVLVLGHEIALPDAAGVPHLLRDQPLSVVLNIAALSQADQTRYVNTLLAELDSFRTATGIPQWVLIDEAQYFFHERAPCTYHLLGTGNFLFATYRPSQVAESVFGAVQAHLITHTAAEGERYFTTSLLQARGPRDLIAADALAELRGARAALFIEDPEQPRWQVFTPGARLTSHAHHARKYADIHLPDNQAFRFLYTNGAALAAHNVVEFHSVVRRAPMASLRHHMHAGDFSRWAAEVLGDAQLAQGLRKLERTVQAGANPDRDEILAHIEDHYLIRA